MTHTKADICFVAIAIPRASEMPGYKEAVKRGPPTSRVGGAPRDVERESFLRSPVAAPLSTRKAHGWSVLCLLARAVCRDLVDGLVKSIPPAATALFALDVEHFERTERYPRNWRGG